MRKLRQISVFGMGLLGSSVTLAAMCAFSGVRTVGFSHRASTRRKARKLGVADRIADDLCEAVRDADIVVLATPICTFEDTFRQIRGALKDGCIVTDVGSTKVFPHRWAARILPGHVHYVGSHPIAGSEKRGVEFARDDLFAGANCIITRTKRTNAQALRTVKDFWSEIGCLVTVMKPLEHDKIFANVSHLPHITAAAIVNATGSDEMKLAGKGFLDTSRIASGPSNIWADIFMTNSVNCVRGIDRLVRELGKLRKAIANKDEKRIKELLEKARSRRSELIKHKIKKKEII